MNKKQTPINAETVTTPANAKKTPLARIAIPVIFGLFIFTAILLGVAYQTNQANKYKQSEVMNTPYNLQLDVHRADWVTEGDIIKMYFSLVNNTNQTFLIENTTFHVVALTRDNQTISLVPIFETGAAIELPAKSGRSRQFSLEIPHKEHNILRYLALEINSANSQQYYGKFTNFDLMAMYNMMPKNAQVSESTNETTVTQKVAKIESLEKFLSGEDVKEVTLPKSKVKVSVPKEAIISEVTQTSKEIEDTYEGGTYLDTSDDGPRCYKLPKTLSIDVSELHDCYYESIQYRFWSDDRFTSKAGEVRIYHNFYPADIADVGDYSLERATTQTVTINNTTLKMTRLPYQSFVVVKLNNIPVTIYTFGEKEEIEIEKKIIESIKW